MEIEDRFIRNLLQPFSYLMDESKMTTVLEMWMEGEGSEVALFDYTYG